MSKKIIISIFIILITFLIFQFNKKNDNTMSENEEIHNTINNQKEKNDGILASSRELELKDIDGRKTNYSFIYKGEIFNATYTKDNWHIEDSYKITNKNDIAIICQELINIHPIHGKDMKSFRKIDDLVYEWLQHNIAYNNLPENSKWKDNVKSVDLDPADQGRSLKEIYEARTGKEFNIKDIK